MKRIPGPVVIATILVGAAAVVAALVARPSGGAPPILLITIDTLRADRLGCYGHAGARTPHLDRLAAEGTLWEDATSPAPLTLPAHASILTGLLPPRHGLRDNSSPVPLPPAGSREFRTAAEILREARYRTAAFLSGEPLAARWGLDAGFEVYDAPFEGEPGVLTLPERDGAATVDRALEWLRDRDASRPFFLWVHLFDPHIPYRAPGGSGAPIDSPQAYDEEVAFADVQVGRLLSALEKEGILDQTVVAACSDHGEGLGEHGETTHGYFLYRSTLRVPLLLRYPRAFRAGARERGPVSLVDVLPTLLSAARRPLPPHPLDGRSLAGPAPSPAPETSAGQYAESLYGWRSFRRAQMVSFREGDRRVIDQGGGRREVYDLAADPGETKPLDPASGAAAAEKAWSVFTSRPRTGAAAPVRDPSLAALGYVSDLSPVEVAGPEANGKLPLASAAFVRRLEGALRQLDRAVREESAEEASRLLETAMKTLEELDREDPGNPAIPFWLGRAHRQKAKLIGGALQPWFDAFSRFQEAGRRGYREPRTVSLMMEAAFQAQQYEDMLRVARDAVEKARMDGDSGFWTWVALAWLQGGREPGGILPGSARAAFDDAIARALARARSEEERARIREVQALGAVTR